MQSFFAKIAWSPTIGDPTFMGWFTVALYFFCAYQSWRVCRYGERIFDPPLPRQKNLWLLITFTMAFLGVNKQLDLQSFFTAAARYFALEQGWYQDRRQLQQGFIVAVAILGIAAAITLIATYAKVLKRHVFAIVGLCGLMVFVLIRATSFHAMDIFIGRQVLGLYLNWVLELGGIGLIIYNAHRLYRQRRPLIDLNALQKPHRAAQASATTARKSL